MGLKDELTEEVGEIFRRQWEQREGYVVPTDSAVKLSNDGVKIDGTVLYADISESTSLVETTTDYVAAEIYKSFLRCAAKIISTENGTITAYDGDRIMAVFVGNNKESESVRAALKLNWTVRSIINLKFQAIYSGSYGNRDPILKHVVGIDSSKLFVARTGIRGANDLVWIGRAANYAAKLTSLSHNYATYITNPVYLKLDRGAQFSAAGVDMWTALNWTSMNNARIYASTYWWPLN